MNESNHCTGCPRELRDHEAGRYLCRPCEDRVAAALNDIPVRYQKLGSLLHRGASTGPAVSGSKSAPVPLRLDVLEMQLEKGPILGTLQAWVRDWEFYGHAELHETGSLQERVAGACGTLRYNLRWAVEQHPAVDEAAYEIGLAHRALVGITSGEKPARHVTVTCPCQQPLRITLGVQALTCPGCRTEYGHGEILRLPLAERRAAA
ncbi:hypothetical protein OG259_07760 [Streptomyces sp. NBC_00250]|uniref:hypothetical protein n=1 Tax=Streptomyces sp. NBC_00250 TaxID=2903641 RepID=UPI002E2A062B|nr:hypothetical protein [Streptomyces sp. NBC_00250]